MMGGMDDPEPFVLLNLKYKQSPQALIPFVGYFLDYPVAYSVGECRTLILQDVEEEGVQKSNCLGHEDLTVFSARWTEDDSLSGCKWVSLPFALACSAPSWPPPLCRRAQDASPWHPLFSFSVPTSLLPSLTACRTTGPDGKGALQTVEEEIRDVMRTRIKSLKAGAPKGKLQQKWSKSVKVEIEVKSGVRLDRVALWGRER
jgi:hypothetical protein